MRVYDSCIPFGLFEINGSRTENYTDTEFTAHIDFICEWDYRNYYVNILQSLVYPQYIRVLDDGTYDTSFYNYYYPAAVMTCNVSNMGAEGVNVALASTASEIHYQQYTAAKISVEYKAIARPGAWSVQESITPNFSGRQLPSWGFYWRSDGSPILDGESPFVQELQVDINRTITGVREVPWWFYGLGGKTNVNIWNDVFTGEAYLPGTLLFVPSNMQRTVTYSRADDDYIWTIGFNLKYNPIGWNSWRRPHGVDMMMYDGAPVFVYGLATYPDLVVHSSDVMIGDDYGVWVEYENGSVGYIEVDSYGNVWDLTVGPEPVEWWW